MAKLSKKIRKGAKRLVQSDLVQDVLEDLIAAALLAAAARLADTPAATKVKRKAERTMEELGGGAKPKAARPRKKARKRGGKK